MNKEEYLSGTGKVGYQHSSRYCSSLKESCTVHFAFCIVHCEWTVHCALCIVHCALGIALCTVLCAFCIVHCALCIVRCAVGSHFGSMPRCTRVHVHFALCSVHRSLYVVQCVAIQQKQYHYIVVEIFVHALCCWSKDLRLRHVRNG